MHDPPPCPSSALFSFPHLSFSCKCSSFHLIILSIHYCLFCTHKTSLFESHSYLYPAFQKENFFAAAGSPRHITPHRGAFRHPLPVHAKTSFSRPRLSVVLPLLLPLTCKPSHTPLPPSLSPTIWQAATTINMVPILPGLIHIYGTSTRWALSCNLRKVMMSSKVFNAWLQARPACNPLFSRWARMRAPRLCACGLEYCTNVLLTCLEVFLFVHIKKRLWLLLLLIKK